ncbi:MAG: hypothetical protein KJO25_05530 [Bacteroidia bacterium]|nr:hypothetical protein [Bacteroidia bacterium]
MKLVIITVVDNYSDDILMLFKASGIDRFSGSDIEGFRNTPAVLRTSSWFPADEGGNESSLFFSFDSEEKINDLLDRIKTYNATLESDNPVRAIVLPIERFV